MITYTTTHNDSIKKSDVRNIFRKRCNLYIQVVLFVEKIGDFSFTLGKKKFFTCIIRLEDYQRNNYRLSFFEIVDTTDIASRTKCFFSSTSHDDNLIQT